MNRWLPLVAMICVGALFGLGGWTFVYADGHSYLRDDPAVCGNCHIMDEHLAAWSKSSHKAVATCNDCHTPHDLIGKYVVKAKNGFWHSFYFTTGNYPDPLRITPANHEVTEAACRYCHADITYAIDAGSAEDAVRGATLVPLPQAHPEPSGATVGDEPGAMSCTRCHRYVGHEVR